MGWVTEYRRARSYDGGTYDTRPPCRTNRRRYIGARARVVVRTVLGYPTWGKCEGCWTVLRLRRGRVPPHTPGPPPNTRCPMCGRRVTPNYNIPPGPPCSLCAAHMFDDEEGDPE